MATKNPHSLSVNQKLAFVRVQLQTIEQPLADMEAEGLDIDRRLVVHAYLDAALLQLCDAVVYFVREMAVECNIASLPTCLELETLLAHLSKRETNPQELNELLRMAQQKNSWLFDLLLARSDPQFPLRQFIDASSPNDVSAMARSSLGPTDMVPLRNLDSTSRPFDQLRFWASSLQDLIERHRQSMLEE